MNYDDVGRRIKRLARSVRRRFIDSIDDPVEFEMDCYQAGWEEWLRRSDLPDDHRYNRVFMAMKNEWSLWYKGISYTHRKKSSLVAKIEFMPYHATTRIEPQVFARVAIWQILKAAAEAKRANDTGRNNKYAETIYQMAAGRESHRYDPFKQRKNRLKKFARSFWDSERQEA